MLTSPSSLPLVLDLDGTLIRTDTFHEMMFLSLFQKPWVLCLIPFWLLKSRAYAKVRLGQAVNLSPQTLPYNLPLLNYAKEEALKGRPLILATGTNQKLAQKIADHLGIFQEVIGSDEHINMTGPFKEKALVTRFGLGGFDYAGDSHKDIHVWQSARIAIVVRPKRGVLKHILSLKAPETIHCFPQSSTLPHDKLKAEVVFQDGSG